MDQKTGKPVCMVNQVMASDTALKSDPLWVSQTIEGCSAEFFNYKQENSTSSEIKPRKKCASCTGILHDQAIIQPLASFHERCFHCNRCDQQLSPLNFKMINGMPYCEPNCQNVCVRKVSQDKNHTTSSKTTNVLTFIPANPSMVKNGIGAQPSISHQCAVCEQICKPNESVSKDGFFYHTRCLKCDICNTPLSINDDKWVGGRPYCTQHYSTTTKGNQNVQMKNSSRRSTTNSEWTIPIQICDPNSKSLPVQMTRIVKPKTSASLDSISETSSSRSTNRNTSITIERKMNDHMESGMTVYTRKSHTPPMKRMPRFEARYNSMKNLSKTPVEHHCVVCGKTVYPSVKVSHKSRIYHDTCIRCEICHQPLTVNTMHVFQSTILCNKHYLSNTLKNTDIRSKRAVSLERSNHASSEDENSVTIDDSGTTPERSTNMLKIPSNSAFRREHQEISRNNNSSVSVMVNRKPSNLPRTPSYTLLSPINSPRESPQEYRIRNGSPYEQITSSWSGEINRQIKTKTKVSRIRTVKE